MYIKKHQFQSDLPSKIQNQQSLLQQDNPCKSKVFYDIKNTEKSYSRSYQLQSKLTKRTTPQPPHQLQKQNSPKNIPEQNSPDKSDFHQLIKNDLYSLSNQLQNLKTNFIPYNPHQNPCEIISETNELITQSKQNLNNSDQQQNKIINMEDNLEEMICQIGQICQSIAERQTNEQGEREGDLAGDVGKGRTMIEAMITVGNQVGSQAQNVFMEDLQDDLKDYFIQIFQDDSDQMCYLQNLEFV